MRLFDCSVKTLLSRPTALKTKNKGLNDRYNSNLTWKIPEDLILPSSQEDEVHLEAPSEILRDAGEIPDLTTEVTKDIEIEKTCEEEILEEFIPPPMDVDIEMRPDDENQLNEEELQIPPPFEVELDKTENVSAFMKEVEEEENQDDKDDIQDKRWTKRTQQTLHMLQKNLQKKRPVNFKDLTKKCSRKQVAYRFYTILILNKEKTITVEQDGVFGDINIDRGEKFSEYV